MTLEKGSRSQDDKDVQLYDSLFVYFLLACNPALVAIVRPGKFFANKFSVNEGLNRLSDRQIWP